MSETLPQMLSAICPCVNLPECAKGVIGVAFGTVVSVPKILGYTEAGRAVEKIIRPGI